MQRGAVVAQLVRVSAQSRRPARAPGQREQARRYRLLHTGVGLVELPRRLGNQLTQKIAVTHRVECVINQVRAHDCISP